MTQELFFRYILGKIQVFAHTPLISKTMLGTFGNVGFLLGDMKPITVAYFFLPYVGGENTLDIEQFPTFRDFSPTTIKISVCDKFSVPDTEATDSHWTVRMLLERRFNIGDV